MAKRVDMAVKLPKDEGQPLTIEEAAVYLRCGINAVYEALRSGRLKGGKIGRSWRITREAINKYLNGD